jgi:hypothetical protein
VSASGEGAITMAVRPTIFACRFAAGADALKPLPLFGVDASLATYHHVDTARMFLKALRLNKYLMELLIRFPTSGLAEWWLTSGCLAQTVWNVQSGRSPGEGVLDYDLFYFDPDLSWRAEERVLAQLERRTSDLPIKVQARNQARVHLWYQRKFGIPYPPVRSARHALRRFPTTTTAVGITANGAGDCRFYAPFGLSDALNMVVKPNRRLPIQTIYEQKAARWKSVWRNLIVHNCDGTVSQHRQTVVETAEPLFL